MSTQLRVSTKLSPTKQLPGHLYRLPAEAHSAPGISPDSHSLLHMQRLYGNRYVQHAIATGQKGDGEISLVGRKQINECQLAQRLPEATGLHLQLSRLRQYRDSDPMHDPAKLSLDDIKATNEYRAYMNPTLVWQSQLHLTSEEAIAACRLILGEMRKGVSISWQRDARTYALKARQQLGIPVELPTGPKAPAEPAPEKAAPEKKVDEETAKEKKVSTLCHRDFKQLMPGWMARHCFIWGHPNSVLATPKNIQQPDTITYDNEVSGEKDPVPHKNTVCTRTFDTVNPDIVRQQYKALCEPKDYNLTSFNCCTCAYLALSAAGAKLTASDFPPQNQGMSLPDSFGSGWKKGAAEALWFNDIDELEKILDKNLTIEQIRKVPLEMKAKWIRDMMRGLYTTKNEGKVVLKLFRGTAHNTRPELYRQVEGHKWSGDWKEGIFTVDDDMVDALSRSQLNELRDIINGKE